MSGLPTNSGLAKDKGCSPVSSNCVVWQGPDLDCIGLCKGDSISEVIAKLAAELCIIIEQFDLEEYDFTCLQIQPSGAPTDLQGLIQILIDRICVLEGIENPTTGDSTSDCPDNCIVPIAGCFEFFNPQGDRVTTMTLIEYVTAIGNQICTNIDDIIVLQNEVQTLQDIVNGDGTGAPITDTAGIVGAIETIELTYATKSSLQYNVSVLTNPSTPGAQYIPDALRDVENSLLSTQAAVGSALDAYQAILKEGLIGDEDKLIGSGNMKSINGWTASSQNTAESLANLWLTINDVREAVQYMQDNCCSSKCTDIWLNFRATVQVTSSTYVTIFTDGSTGFNSEWKELNGRTDVLIEDALGNTTTFSTALIPLIDVPTGYVVDITATSIDPTQTLTVTAKTSFFNTDSEVTCEKDYVYTIDAATTCPAVTLTVYATAINYMFASTVGSSYIVNIFYRTGTTAVATQIIPSAGVTVLNSISGLLPQTAYEFELVVVNSSGVETTCARMPFVTLVDNCTPPINATAVLVI